LSLQSHKDAEFLHRFNTLLTRTSRSVKYNDNTAIIALIVLTARKY
jgi:hypothetical protein